MDQSGLSLNRSTIEERRKNLGYIRGLYMLFALELLIVVVWATICIGCWKNRMGSWWIFGLVFGCICAIVVLAVLFVDSLRK